jgi:O-antigen/teichoic acid export membrane protein
VTPPIGGRRRLAGGALTVAAGLTVTGAGTLVMMALAARSLPPSEYAAFAVWWTMATFLGTSFGVFEAYLARLALADVAAGREARAVTGSMTGRALAMSAAIGAVLLVLTPWLGTEIFAGSFATALLLPVFVVLSATQAIQRGVATGYSRFRAIGAQLAADGLTRVVLVGGLIATDLDSVGTLALASCLSATVGLVVGDRMCREWLARPRLLGDGVSSRPLVLLLVASVGPLLVNNGSVPWLAGTHAVSPYTLGAFAGAVTISRLPAQFIAAAFGPLLAQLSHAVETGDTHAFHRLRRFAGIAAAALGLTFVGTFALLGQRILTAYLGVGYQLSVGILAVLAAASGLMFVMVVPQASLAALDRWSSIAVAWVGGTVVFGIVLLLPLAALQRAALAPLGAVLTALILMLAVHGIHERPGRTSLGRWLRRRGSGGPPPRTTAAL